MQAGYTRFNYLTETTKKIVEREALLGCSITGFMDNPEILLDSKIQKKGAEEIKKTNKKRPGRHAKKPNKRNRRKEYKGQGRK